MLIPQTGRGSVGKDGYGAKEFGLTLKIYYVDTDYQTCKERNKPLKRLSQDVLKQIYNEFQTPTPDEGKIIIVN